MKKKIIVAGVLAVMGTASVVCSPLCDSFVGFASANSLGGLTTIISCFYINHLTKTTVDD